MRFSHSVVALLVAAAPVAALAQDPVRYSAEAFFATTSYATAAPSGLAFSPDGKSVLISSDASGVFNVYALPVAGGKPVPLTDSRDNARFAESYFPNDGRIILTGDTGGNELDHVYVRAADGSVRDITPGEKLKANFIGWAQDRRSFWISTNERDPAMFDLYRVDAQDYSKTLAFRNSGFTLSAVSPDGRHVALVKRHSSANSDIYLAEIGGSAEPRLITQHQGNVAYGVFDFTRDGKSLVYSTDERGEWTQAWTHDLVSGAKAPLVAADWDVSFVNYSPSGKYRVSALNADASTRLTIADGDGKSVTLSGVPAGDLGNVRFNRDETMIAFTVVSDTSPRDIFVADLATGRARRLTTALNPAIEERRLVEATVHRFKSYDGLEVPGILYRPKGSSASKPAPLVIDVHGGPGGQSRRGYSAEFQHLVNHGYAVFRINNRGSSGYGKTFFHLDDKKHGDVDLKDVVAAKTALQGLDWIADDRAAVMGGSYGGYMVAAALAFAPDVFDAGVNIFGVTNWVRTLQSIPAWWGPQRQALYDELGDPAVDAERHRRISPLFHAKNIRKPLLVIQGANDPRVLKVESDELVAAVKANNVPVEYVVFPDEGHGFLRKANRITASDAWLRFLDTHLKARP